MNINCSSSDVDRYQESFPISSFDFNSSLAVEGFYSTCDDDDDNNDVDAYIEIELEQGKTPASTTRKNKGEIDEEEEVELRISLSAVCRKSSSANVFSFSSTSCSGDGSASAVGSKTFSTIFPPTWKRLEPSVDDEDFQCQTPTINREFLQIRKAPKDNGGVMKILVKFRSISFRSMLASLLKLGKFTPKVYGISEVTPENRRSSLKPLDKLFPKKSRRGIRNGERSKLSEINLEGIRKLFGSAVGMKTSNQTRQPNSCQNSMKSSPINENMFYSRENSVQAAIAHCKKSFGQTDDFCFSY